MKFRETICKYYICKGECFMNKSAEHKGICQHCTKYEPRFTKKYINRKKAELDKAKKLSVVVRDYE